MTRDELIAKVYEKCGWKAYAEDDHWAVRHPDGGGYWVAYVGLDEFVCDIVPVLNERGWFATLPLQQGYPKEWDGEWAASLIGPGWALRKVESTDPVEAAFAVALEVLGE